MKSAFVFIACLTGFLSVASAQASTAEVQKSEIEKVEISYTAEQVLVSNAWLRETPPTAQVSGGYLQLHNKMSEDVYLVAVKSAYHSSIEIHEMLMRDGKMSMKQMKRLRIKAGETLTLEPGGLHLMMFNPEKHFKAGEKVPVTLLFEKGGMLDVELEVKRQ